MGKYLRLAAFVIVATHAVVFAFTGLSVIAPLPDSGESFIRALLLLVFHLVPVILIIEYKDFK
jgi:hypothetical protein